MIRAVCTRLGVLSLLTAGSLAVGCGSDDGGKETETGNLPAGATTLTLTFSPMYSAFIEGGPDCKLPVIAKGATGKVTFTAEDQSMVDVEPTAEGAMLTMKKAGTTTITGTAEDGSFGRATLTITGFTNDDFTLGADRYDNGVVAFNIDGGMPMPGMGGFNPAMFMPDKMSACTFCHRPDGQSAGADPGAVGMIDIEHTPQQIGGYSDEDLIKIFTEAKKPDGVGARIVPAFIWSMIHQWDVDEATQRGIIAYLRQITPKTQGEIDFGGIIRMRFDGGLPNFGDGGFPGGGGAAAGGGAAGGGGAAADTGTAADDPDAGTADPDAG